LKKNFGLYIGSIDEAKVCQYCFGQSFLMKREAIAILVVPIDISEKAVEKTYLKWAERIPSS
jgi:hypothetical protein